MHYISQDGDEYRGLGEDLGLKSGAKCSAWVEGEYLCYIDASAHKRRLPRVIGAAKSGLPGSIWVEGDWLHILAEETATKNQVHGDYSDHGDIAHEDVPHSDHRDYTDFDGHIDRFGTEEYVDWDDSIYWNDWTDEVFPHHDGHHWDGYGDAPYQQWDDWIDSLEHSDKAHSDAAHNDGTVHLANPEKVA